MVDLLKFQYIIHVNYYKILQTDARLIPSHTFPDKDGLFWLNEANCLPGVAVIDFWDSSAYELYLNPFADNFEPTFSLHKKGFL